MPYAKSGQLTKLTPKSIIWSIATAADYAGVSIPTYRRKILSLPGHPEPRNPGGKQAEYIRAEMVAFLENPENLRIKAA